MKNIIPSIIFLMSALTGQIKAQFSENFDKDILGSMTQTYITNSVDWLNCDVITPPWSESFENSFNFACWENTGTHTNHWSVGSNYNYNHGPYSASDGIHYLYFYIYSTPFGRTTTATTPTFDMSNLSNPQLTFDYWMNGPADPNLWLKVEMSTDGANWNEIFYHEHDGINGWKSVAIPLAGVTSTTRFRFIAVSDAGSYNTSIDNLSVGEGSNCPPPGGLSASNITTNSAELSWTQGFQENNWNIEYGPTGFTPGQGTTISLNTNSYSLNGLSGKTTYDFYVQADCGGNTSTWTGPYTFTTPGTCGFYSFEFFRENHGGYQGRLSVYVNAVAYLSDILTSYDNNIQSYYVPVDQEDVLSFDYTPGDYSEYDEYIVYDNNGNEIAHEGANDTEPDDIGNPDILTGLQACPSCPATDDLAVSNITNSQAELSWVNGGTETSWNIEYGPYGHVPGQGTTINVTTNPYTLTGLSSGTLYDYYVQADCGGGDTGIWVGPFTFFTTCDVISTFPYDYGFEGASSNTAGSWNNSCWYGIPDNADPYTSNGPYRWRVFDENAPNIYFGGPSTAHSGELYAYTESVGSSDGDVAKMISPVFDMSGLTQPQLSFFYHMYGQDTRTLYVDVFDGTTWVENLWSITGEQQASTDMPWQQAFVLIPNTTTQIRFRAVRGGNAYKISIDDINIKEAPSCLAPSLLSVANITADSADLSWTENGTATTWNIEYGPVGFTPGSGTVITGITTNPYTLNNLTHYLSYDYYVQADCGGGDTSAWVGPYNFMTLPGCGFYNLELLSSNSTYGWGGAKLNVYVNGVAYLTDLTLYSGSGFKSYEIPLEQDDILSFDYIRVNPTYYNYNYNNEYKVYDNLDNLIIDEGANNTEPGDVGDPNVPTGPIACPSCPAPSGLLDSNVTDNAVDLSWTENGNATTWNIEYGPIGFTQGQGTLLTGITSTPYTLTGLDSNTTYAFYVQADCGSHTSFWGGPHTFTTLPCIAPDNLSISNLGYDSVGLSWTQNGSSTSWNIEYGPSGFTQGQGTILSNVSTNPYTLTGLTPSTTYDFYVQADCGASGGTGTSDWEGPLTATTTPTPGTCGLFRVDLLDGHNDGWNGGSLTVYINGVVYLSNITMSYGTNIESYYIPVNIDDILSFEYTPGGYSYENLYIVYDNNNIEVAHEGGNDTPGSIGDPSIPTGLEACPSCPPPTDLSTLNIASHSVDLSWTAGGNETAWVIEYGPTGFTQGQGTIINVTNNPYNLTGLTTGMHYDYYVKADCGGGDNSRWEGPYSFVTTCDTVINFPYNYGFEYVTTGDGGDWSSSCWTANPENTGALIYEAPFRWLTESDNAPPAYTGPEFPHSGTSYAYTNAINSNNGDIAELLSPVLDLSSLSQPLLSFYYHMYGAEIGILYIDTFDGSTWTECVWSLSGEQQTSGDDTWQQAFINIPVTVTQIKFRAVRGDGDAGAISIDDISIQEMPSCLPPNHLSVVNKRVDSADLLWTDNNSATTWNIEYGPKGFTPGQGTMISGATSNPYHLTGLTSMTYYDFYVQSNCNGSGNQWSVPYTFMTPPGCGDTFYDDGGPYNPYSQNIHQIITIYPDNAGEVVAVTFDLLSLEVDDDYMFVYDGPDTNSPIIPSSHPDGMWTGGYSATGYTFTATNATGALTLEFTTDGFLEYSGWDVSVSCIPSNINELTNILGIYPNPTTGKFVIKSHDLMNAEVYIYSITGKEIYQNTIDKDNYFINLKNVKKGIYFVKITSNNKSYISKLIVK